MQKFYLSNLKILGLCILFTGCSGFNSENYPDLSKGFKSPRETPERPSIISEPSKSDSSDLEPINVDLNLEPYEKQKVILEHTISDLEKVENTQKQRQWFSIQLEFTKLSKIVEELERQFKGGKPAGEFISIQAEQLNMEIESYMIIIREKISQLKP